MKLRLLWIIVIHFILVSCNDDDNETFVNQEFLDELSGIYTLKTAILNEPIDINGDGIENTDFLRNMAIAKQIILWNGTGVHLNLESLTIYNLSFLELL